MDIPHGFFLYARYCEFISSKYRVGSQSRRLFTKQQFTCRIHSIFTSRACQGTWPDDHSYVIQDRSVAYKAIRGYGPQSVEELFLPYYISPPFSRTFFPSHLLLRSLHFLVVFLFASCYGGYIFSYGTTKSS